MRYESIRRALGASNFRRSSESHRFPSHNHISATWQVARGDKEKTNLPKHSAPIFGYLKQLRRPFLLHHDYERPTQVDLEPTSDSNNIPGSPPKDHPPPHPHPSRAPRAPQQPTSLLTPSKTSPAFPAWRLRWCIRLDPIHELLLQARISLLCSLSARSWRKLVCDTVVTRCVFVLNWGSRKPGFFRMVYLTTKSMLAEDIGYAYEWVLQHEASLRSDLTEEDVVSLVSPEEGHT